MSRRNIDYATKLILQAVTANIRTRERSATDCKLISVLGIHWTRSIIGHMLAFSNDTGGAAFQSSLAAYGNGKGQERKCFI